MDFNYQYCITYRSGQSYERPHTLTAQIAKEEYKKIIQGVLQGIPISKIEGIADAISQMTENVRSIDRWTNINGSHRKTPLKQEREIVGLEFFLPESEYRRIKKMKDPMAVFDRPQEHMTLYRNDGSSVTLTAENGLVQIHDSKNTRSYSIMEIDNFLSRIIW